MSEESSAWLTGNGQRSALPLSSPGQFVHAGGRRASDPSALLSPHTASLCEPTLLEGIHTSTEALCQSLARAFLLQLTWLDRWRSRLERAIRGEGAAAMGPPDAANNKNLPVVVIAGTSSGVGKTSISCGVLRALRQAPSCSRPRGSHNPAAR